MSRVGHCLIFLVLISFASHFVRAQPDSLRFSTVKRILAEVSRDSLFVVVKQLSGAVPVTIGGIDRVLKTRRILTTGNRLATQLVYEKMKGYNLQVEYQGYYPDYSYWGSALITPTFTRLSFSKDGSRGWLCNNYGEILTSIDSGRSWIPRRDSRIPEQNRVDWVSMLNSNTIIALGKTGWMVRSTDCGFTWNADSIGFANPTDLFINKSARLWVLGEQGQLYISTDTGTTWSKNTIASDAMLSAMSCLDSSHFVLVGKSSSGIQRGVVYESRDGGVTFQQVTGNWDKPLTRMQVLTPRLGWIGGMGGRVYRTTDGGSNWTKHLLPDTTATINRVFFCDSLFGWAIPSQGMLYHSTDGGISWLSQPPIYYGLMGIEDVFFFDRARGIAVSKVRSNIRTEDGGQTWVDYSEPPFRNVIARLRGKRHPGKYFLINAHVDSYSMVNPWLVAPGANDNASGTAVVVEAARVLRNFDFDYSIMLATYPDEETGGAGAELHASSFAAMNDTLLGVINVDVIGCDQREPKLLYIDQLKDTASTSISERLKALISAFKIDLSVYQEYTYGASDIQSFQKRGYAGILLGTLSLDSIHKPTDTWTTLNPVFYENVAKAAIATIADLALGEPQAPQENPLPKEYALDQNYPNPFNLGTVIRYHLPTKSVVKLEVYNVLGQLIATLVDETQPASSYDTRWTPTEASGVYFYCLQAVATDDPRHTHVFTRKMILLK